jgi:hypothetical protein
MACLPFLLVETAITRQTEGADGFRWKDGERYYMSNRVEHELVRHEFGLKLKGSCQGTWSPRMTDGNAGAVLRWKDVSYEITIQACNHPKEHTECHENRTPADFLNVPYRPVQERGQR